MNMRQSRASNERQSNCNTYQKVMLRSIGSYELLSSFPLDAYMCFFDEINYCTRFSIFVISKVLFELLACDENTQGEFLLIYLEANEKKISRTKIELN